MKKPILFITFLLFCLCTFSQNTIKLKHTYYTSIYDTTLKAELVGYYVQTKEHALVSNGKLSLDRKKFGRFTHDPLIPKSIQKIVTNQQYSRWNSKYKKLGKQLDKGHLVPYSAMAFDTIAAIESMYLENTSPQAYKFNEHQWKRVEMEVLKKISPIYGDVKVWTGVLIDTSHLKMGNLYIPDYYWKVIQYKSNNKIITKAWLGVNSWNNNDTNPDNIIIDEKTLKTIVLKYHPKLVLEF